MINTDMNQFIDYLNYGEEIDILYKGDKYLIEGYCNEDNNFHLFVYKYENGGNEADEMIYEIDSNISIKDCADKFLEAKIWNGKSFWEVEKEMEWID